MALDGGGRERENAGEKKEEGEREEKEEGERERKRYVQHIAFPRGPPPQYYRYSRQLNFAVRMGSGDPA